MAELERNMDRARPQLLVAQRDSDANKDVEGARANAFAQCSTLSLRTGSILEKQFEPSYVPRVFNITLPWCVGGPDFPKKESRRKKEKGPAIALDTWVALMASRCESQIRFDWEFLPGIMSLNFASKVNLGMSLSINRALRRGAGAERLDEDIGKAAARIYELLMTGEYEQNGRRLPMKGDISKLERVIGATDTERALIRNAHFMSARLQGTRQIRGSIRHVVFATRVVYGVPIFMTLTPSERHSGLAIRLFRGRRKDPAFTCAAQGEDRKGKKWLDNNSFVPYLGYDSPSLKPLFEEFAFEEAAASELPIEGLDLPEYDLRRLITARDPLCCVNAFLVSCKVVFPGLFGFRMCPRCPDCAMSENPCMDIFGSNATPMGGGAGRCDAAVGAVEAQKAEGVLHLHLFLYPQMVNQFSTMQELADKLRDGILSAKAWKEYVSHVRVASYPDPVKAERDREATEKAWPAYATDQTLSRLTFELWADTAGTTSPHFMQPAFGQQAWETDAHIWLSRYNTRLQHALLHMNHHVHPLINAETGERRVLNSCRPKDGRNTCKSDFPLHAHLTDSPLLVCKCIANERGLVQRGPRSMLGTVLPRRTDEIGAWLNAGPRVWLALNADNGDLKFPHRLPIIPETHESTQLYDVRRHTCCSTADLAAMLYDFQAGLSMAAGYFGGYTAKMQDVGHRELQRMNEALARKVSVEPKRLPQHAFNLYSKRLVKDLEAKGIIRTAVECVNLALQADCYDVLRAEMFATMPRVTFKASLLLKREEVETRKVAGHSIIAAVLASKQSRKAYLEAPFDTLYGFRGREYNVIAFIYIKRVNL